MCLFYNSTPKKYFLQTFIRNILRGLTRNTHRKVLITVSADPDLKRAFYRLAKTKPRKGPQFSTAMVERTGIEPVTPTMST